MRELFSRMKGYLVGLMAGVVANLWLLSSNFFATCSVACLAPPLSVAGVVLVILLVPMAIGHIVYNKIWKNRKKK